MTRMDDALERWLNPPPPVEIEVDPNAPIFQLMRLLGADKTRVRRVEWLDDPTYCEPVYF